MSEAPATPKPPSSGGMQVPLEVELNIKIKALQEGIATVEREIRVAQGRVANGDPKVAQKLREENEQLKARFKKLERAVLSVLIAGMRPKQARDEKLRNDVIIKSVIEYCKKAKVDEQIWKSLES